jgi:hypothetical protein
MNLYFLIWSFGLGVLAGLIAAVVRDEYRRRRVRRIEAEAVRRFELFEIAKRLRPGQGVVLLPEEMLWSR